AGVDLLAVGRLHARNFDTSVGANDRKAVRLERNDFAELAADPFRVFRRQRLGVENLYLLAVERRPGTGRRIAAADQPIDLFPGFATVDPGILGAATALIGGFGFLLFDARRFAGFDQIDRFEHGIDAHREQAIKVDGAERVGRTDWRFLLDEDVPGIEAVIRPEDRQPGFRLALDDRPIDCARATIGG